MITDPRKALADDSSFISYLTGLAGLAQVVKAIAADAGDHTAAVRDADSFVYLLMGVVRLGGHIDALVESTTHRDVPTPSAPSEIATRWLR